MSQKAARFTEADLNRAGKCAARFPYPVAIEIKPDGTIRLEPVQKTGESGELPAPAIEEAEVATL
jgi:hypothetical protein